MGGDEIEPPNFLLDEREVPAAAIALVIPPRAS
jgi:hypothetical protein